MAPRLHLQPCTLGVDLLVQTALLSTHGRGYDSTAGRDHRRGSSVGGGGGGRRRGFVGRSLDRVFGRRRVAPHDDELLVRTTNGTCSQMTPWMGNQRMV
jgi:hypothetical protein